VHAILLRIGDDVSTQVGRGVATRIEQVMRRVGRRPRLISTPNPGHRDAVSHRRPITRAIRNKSAVHQIRQRGSGWIPYGATLSSGAAILPAYVLIGVVLRSVCGARFPGMARSRLGGSWQLVGVVVVALVVSMVHMPPAHAAAAVAAPPSTNRFAPARPRQR
jgi:hypothetical protein